MINVGFASQWGTKPFRRQGNDLDNFVKTMVPDADNIPGTTLYDALTGVSLTLT